MKNHIGLVASILAAVAIIETPSRVYAQSVQASPVRACIVSYLQTRTPSTCTTLETFRQEAAALDECRSAPVEPLSQHFCGVCLVTANRVPTGCESYLRTAPAPWTPPAATSPAPAPSSSTTAMDAAVAPVAVDASSPAPSSSAAPLAVIQMAQVITADGGAPVILTGEVACRALGGFWDSNQTITMERGRVQHGYCLSPEMQAFARAQFGMADTTPPDQVLARIRSNGYVHESRLQEVTTAAETRANAAIAAERSGRDTAIGSVTLELRQRTNDLRTMQGNLRRNLGLDLNAFGGASPMAVAGRMPYVFGIGSDLIVPAGPRIAGVIGLGLGAGFPLDERGLPQSLLFERMGLRYYHAWERFANVDRDGRQIVIGGATPGLGVGIAAYQLLSMHDFHLTSQMFGAYLEGFVSFSVGPARFRAGVMGIVGPGTRAISATENTGLFPDVTILATLGPEFRL